VSSVLLLMLPGIAVLGLNQINQFVTNRFASTLGEGAVTVQFYAYRVTELMYGGIVVQLTTVLLPVMSRQLRQEPAAASATLLDTVRLVSFITLPTATVLAVAARPVIGLLFGGGRFDVAAVTATGAALAAYAFGLVALGHAKVVASAFFAQQDTRTPMVGSALSLLIFTVACWLLAGPLGVPGLGLANTLAMLTYAVMLTAAYVRLHGLRGAPVRPTVVAVGRQVAASVAVGWGLWLTRPWLAGVERTGGQEALRVFAVLGLVSVAYVGLVVLMGGREPATLLAALRGRGRS